MVINRSPLFSFYELLWMHTQYTTIVKQDPLLYYSSYMLLYIRVLLLLYTYVFKYIQLAHLNFSLVSISIQILFITFLLILFYLKQYFGSSYQISEMYRFLYWLWCLFLYERNVSNEQR